MAEPATASGQSDASGCPPGSRFEERAPGSYPLGFPAATGGQARPLHPHYFSGVEVPLDSAFDGELGSELALDPAGIPLGAELRSELLLRRSARLELGEIRRSSSRVSIPISVENVAAGHRMPGGFSQERELWVHLRVTDDHGRVLYEVGRVERADRDLADKRFLVVNMRDDRRDAQGRPLGVFGADVADGPDLPRVAGRRPSSVAPHFAGAGDQFPERLFALRSAASDGSRATVVAKRCPADASAR